MTHRTTVYGLIAASTVLLSACAGVPMQDNRAATAYNEQECKIVYYSSATQSIAAYNKDLHGSKPVSPQTPAEQALAVGQVGNAQIHNPRLLGHGSANVMDDAQRKC